MNDFIPLKTRETQARNNRWKRQIDCAIVLLFVGWIVFLVLVILATVLAEMGWTP